MSGVVKWVFEDYWRGVDQRVTFYGIGAVQTFVVPDGVYQVQLEMRGGAGWGLKETRVSGDFIRGWMPVNPGDVLYINVGGNGLAPVGNIGGAGGWNGGGAGGNALTGRTGGYGGGGPTDVRYGSNEFINRFLVAAGGGGCDGSGKQHGGPGGVPNGFAGEEYYNIGGRGGKQDGPGNGGQSTINVFATGASHTTANAGGSPGAGSVGGKGAIITADAYSKVDAPGGGGGGWFGGGGGGVGVPFIPQRRRLYGDTAAQAYALAQMKFGQVMGGGGGGGSSFIGGFDPGQDITAESGQLFTRLSSTPIPHVTVVYRQTPVVYTLQINPNEGGTPNIEKNIEMSQSVGPNRVNILQEGQNSAPTIQFSGIILEQAQLEDMEAWFDRRAFIKVTDDLGRQFYGVFSKFGPKRERRSSNVWYHTYDAEFILSAYMNASGNWIYGRVSNA